MPAKSAPWRGRIADGIRGQPVSSMVSAKLASDAEHSIPLAILRKLSHRAMRPSAQPQRRSNELPSGKLLSKNVDRRKQIQEQNKESLQTAHTRPNKDVGVTMIRRVGTWIRGSGCALLCIEGDLLHPNQGTHHRLGATEDGMMIRDG